MLLRINSKPNQVAVPAASPRNRRKFLPSGVAACALLLAVFSTAYQGSSQNGPSNNNHPDANRLPDANVQMAMSDQQSKKANFEAANLERKRQISDDSARLLKLASDLKAEVDKTSKDTLSLGVIRKAEEIEKLAHGVKEKMKLTLVGN